MRKSLMLLLGSVAALACAPPAQAQVFGRQRPSSAATEPSQIDCAALARMPNAPMTQAACETMMSQASATQGAMNAPGGDRPGDAAMSCQAVMAELAVQQNVGVSREHLAEGEAAGKDYMARQSRVQAEGTAMVAQQTATSIAAASVSMVPGVGAAAASAAAAANVASSKAFSAHAAAQLGPAQQRLFQASNTSLGDVTRSMQVNPRFARLARLAMEKNCR